MDWLIAPVIGIALSIALSFGRPALRRWLASRATRSTARGGRPSLPVFVKGGRLRYARMARDGADLVVFAGARRAYAVDARAFRDAPSRVVVEEENEREGGLRSLRDPAGRAVTLGPAAEYEAAVLALAEAAPAGLSTAGRWAAALPRSLAVLALLSLVPLLATQALWWSGHDVRARVTAVVPYDENAEDGSGDLCIVSWVEAGQLYTAGVTCYEPYPAVGSTLQVRALAGPLRGNAMDEIESYAGLTAVFGGLVALSLLGAFGWAALRVGATPVRLAAQARPRSPGLSSPVPDDRVSDFVQVAIACARAEGWAQDPPTTPTLPGLHTQVAMAVRDPLWFGVLVGGGVALGFLEGDTTPYAVAGLLAVGALAVWCLVRSGRAWRLIRAPYDQPFSRQLPYVVARTVQDTWTVFLLQDGRPRWAVDFTRGGHPPLSGTAEVRGDLDSGSVHLRVEGQLWVPDTPVYELDDQDVHDVQEGLREVLEDSPR